MRHRFRYILAAALAAASLCAAAVEPALTDAEADANAIVACMDKGRDSQAQQTCIIGMIAIKAIGTRAIAVAAAAPPAATIVQQAPARHWFADLVLGTVQFAKDTAIALANPIAQVIVGRRQAQTNELIASYNRDTQIAQINGYAQINAQSVAAVQNAAGLGFASNAALAAHAQAPGPTYNVSGNGVNFGAGSVTFNPITGSYNPTNPGSRICTSTATGQLNCSP